MTWWIDTLVISLGYLTVFFLGCAWQAWRHQKRQVPQPQPSFFLEHGKGDDITRLEVWSTRRKTVIYRLWTLHSVHDIEMAPKAACDLADGLIAAGARALGTDVSLRRE